MIMLNHFTDNTIPRMCFIAVCLLSNMTAYSGTDIPAGTNQFKLVNGLAIYIGVVPAEILQGHQAHRMHGGLPGGSVRFHLTAAIFYEKSGERINDARISAQILTIPEKTGFKDLELMEYGKVLVYGNYFSLEALGPYVIQLHIEHKKLPGPVDVEFQYPVAFTQLSDT